MTKSTAYPADIRQLTSLRFFAAAWVVVFHFRTHLNFALDDYTLLFQKGYLGVDLFFVLSGFVLAHVYAPALARDNFRYLSFLQKRLARIYPLHLLTFLAAVGIYLGGKLAGFTINSTYFTLDSVLQNLLLIHAWGTTSGFSWNGPSWSISAEAGAYLLFPALVFLVYKIWTNAAATVVVCVVFLLVVDASVYAVAGVSMTALTWEAGILRIVPEFLLGLALYRFGVTVTVPVARLRWSVPSLLLITFASLHYGINDFFIVIQLSAIIFLLSQQSKTPSPSVLTSNWAVYLGEISYSIYMSHSLIAVVYFKVIKMLTGADTIEVLPWSISFFLVLIASAILYRLVELPGRNLLRPRTTTQTLEMKT